ncbi:hypothetical protein EOT10_08825 [Streptomyces antnestii]|uniref:Uncharacterized protein n=1 Tax=Streptomyces antnestii TaxID=2494256 RepID=A0A437PYD3_9ACTN|nr:hypothetical protein [Streptomyces sp. San01]RVU27267.1 hypothetical protein EOT10_08825 [Streptomyces sp. San01]
MTTPPPQGQNPYAQGQQPSGPPQGGAPYTPVAGQPGVPQQPYPPHAPGTPIPPAAPSGGGSKKVLRIVALIVVAIALYGVKWYLGQSDAETTNVGSCMHNDGSTSAPDLKTVDCSSGDSQYKVIEKFDGTSDVNKCNAVKGNEVSYYQTGGSHDVVLCLKQS